MFEIFKILTPFTLGVVLVLTLSFQLSVFYYFLNYRNKNKIKKYLDENTELWEVNDAVNFFKKNLQKTDKE
jgi:hypothetical protein